MPLLRTLVSIGHDGCGPAQALARAVIDTVSELCQRRSRVTVRWTPARAGAEHADSTAKRAAEGREDRAEPGNLGEAGLAHLTRKTTEAQSKAIREWILIF